ncbi:hypothetical protein JCM8547_007362 [Rhodosporidiobolus lusitaniae]
MSGYADDYAQQGDYYHHQEQAGGAPVSITRNLRQHHTHQQHQQDQYGYDGHYGYAENEAHDILEGDDSPRGSDEEVTEQLQVRNSGHRQQQYHQPQHQQQQQGGYYEDEMQGEQGLDHGEGEEEDIDDSGSFSDSMSSSPSIPDEDIDFNLVYALHTFLATVDGQASVVKGDKLMLLDDSNSYWWLVRVLKTQAIGYIPAENIETPWERLARLNKHRNVDLTSATQQDVITGPTSTTAQTRFVSRIPPSQQPHPHESRHPYSKGIPASPSHKDHPRNISPQAEPRPGSSKAKVVLFTTSTYYAHSASGLTTDEEDYGEGGEEGEEGEYEDEGMMEQQEHEQGGGFEDEDEDEEIDEGHQAGGEESEFSDEEEQELAAAGVVRSPPQQQQQQQQSLHDELAGEGGAADEAAKREHWKRETAAAMQAQQQAAAAEAQWAKERELEQQQQQRALSPAEQARRALSPANLNVQQQQHPSPTAPASKRSLSPRFEDGVAATYSPTASVPRSPGSPNGRSTAFDDFVSAPTKKLTATPPIARANSGDEDDSDDDERMHFDPLADAPPSTSELEAAPYDLRHSVAPGHSHNHHGHGQGPLSPTVPSPTSSSGGAGGGPPQRVRGVDLVDPKDPRYHRMLQPTKQAGEDVVYERMMQQQQAVLQQQQGGGGGRRSAEGDQAGDASMTSVETAGGSSVLSASASGGELPSSAGSGKRVSTGGKEDSSKKRKSGGGILGLFRKKDKKNKGGKGEKERDREKEDEPRSSEDSGTAPSSAASFGRRSGSASPGSPRTSADRTSTAPSSVGTGAGSNKRDSATAESMFSTDAALRQQEVEAKQALYQQYGVQRNPGDVSNTMTPRTTVSGANLTPSGPFSSFGGGGEERRSSGSSQRNSLQLLTHPSSVVGANGVLGSPNGSMLNGLQPPQRIRPGSLMGSPSIAGIEVPLLSVMRVFAGEYVESEATFKTVLLNQGTTAADLVKQAMQRFRLVGADLMREDFFLTVKEIGGEERALEDDEKPLGVFEELSERAGDDAALPPSVKRSSIGSISSISSSLSLNPAITRLGMNDWSDDSAVKFYLNRRGGPSPFPLHDGPTAGLLDDHAPTPTQQQGEFDTLSDHTATPTLGSPAQFDGQSPSSAQSSPTTSFTAPPSTPASTPSYRFAVRLLIHPSDLPDTVVFDPHSTAIIPKSVLLERQQRNGGFADAPSSSAVSPAAREKIIFFPRNANVSEVVEAALDRFGIADGVVDGGDEVEDRVSRRRSNTRVKYSLAAEKDGRELLLNASSKLLEAYSAPPLFKAYDRSSKEFRRRSVDATLVLGTANDVQPSDPVFVLRRSAVRATASIAARGPHPQTIDELEERQQQRREEEQEVLAGGSPTISISPDRGPSQRDLIAAQRAAQRANQRAILSAQKNADQGIDINIPEQGTIRSARQGDNDEVRYSFINQDGTEVDISEIVENEWSTRAQGESSPERLEGGHPVRPPPRIGRSASAATTATDGAESFRTAREAPSITSDDDEQQAIDALRSSSVEVDQRRPSASSTTSSNTPQAGPPAQGHDDVLSNALGPRPVTSPVFNESLQERLDRVLARVKEEKARRAASPGGSRPRSYISAASGSATPNGRLSPALSSALSGRVSPTYSSGRRSPLVGTDTRGRDSPSIDQILQPSPRSISATSPPPRHESRHGKKASIASLSSMSGASSSNATTADQPSTPVTAGSGTGSTGAVAFTPASSATSSGPPQQPPRIVYRDDFGYETLEAIVQSAVLAGSRERRAATALSTTRTREEAVERLFGREVGEEVDVRVREAMRAPSKALSDLDAVNSAFATPARSSLPAQLNRPTPRIRRPPLAANTIPLRAIPIVVHFSVAFDYFLPFFPREILVLHPELVVSPEEGAPYWPPWLQDWYSLYCPEIWRHLEQDDAIDQAALLTFEEYRRQWYANDTGFDLVQVGMHYVSKRVQKAGESSEADLDHLYTPPPSTASPYPPPADCSGLVFPAYVTFKANDKRIFAPDRKSIHLYSLPDLPSLPSAQAFLRLAPHAVISSERTLAPPSRPFRPPLIPPSSLSSLHSNPQAFDAAEHAQDDAPSSSSVSGGAEEASRQSGEVADETSILSADTIIGIEPSMPSATALRAEGLTGRKGPMPKQEEDQEESRGQLGGALF